MVADWSLDSAPLMDAQPNEIEFELSPRAAASPVSFADLYTAEFARLVRLATLLTGRPDAARDVVQDAFVKLHLKWAGVRDPAAYVRRSVVNGSRSHHRRAAREAARAERVATGTDSVAGLGVDHTIATLAALSHR
jgi:DNA-directed RNA polymerase specialized sigma24 family protein